MIKKFALLIISTIMLSGCHALKEHREAQSLTLEDINVKTIGNGVYEGTYNGGLYGWRENKVQVVVDSGKIKDITLLYSKELKQQDSIYINLISDVIRLHSLHVNAFSGATLTCKAHLKAIENALKTATRKTINQK